MPYVWFAALANRTHRFAGTPEGSGNVSSGSGLRHAPCAYTLRPQDPRKPCESHPLHDFHEPAGGPGRRADIAPLGLHAHARRARVPPPVHGPRSAGRRRRIGPRHGLYRIRRNRRFAARREPHPNHDAAAHAAHRPPSGRPDGRRHHQGRRSFRQGQEPAIAVQRADRRPTSRVSGGSSSGSSNSAATRP